MANNFYCRTILTGGAAGALDEIDGAGLNDLDFAIVSILNKIYMYTLDDDSAAAEDSPNVISPDVSAGNKRWILQGIGFPTGGSVATPIISFGDGNTGIYEISNDIINIIVGGVEGLRVSETAGVITSTFTDTLNVSGDTPGNVGGFAAGAFQVTSPTATEFSSATITGHNSFSGNTQLWYVGSISSSNNDVAFINRQNANLNLSTNNLTRLTITSVGDFGVNVIDPDTKFEILNAGNQLKLSFDGTDNTTFGVDTNGDLTITPSGSKIIVDGFTELGSAAPAIKMKKLTGTTAATEGSFVDIVHGLTASKILAVDLLIEYSAGSFITDESSSLGVGYVASYLVSSTNVRVINHPTDSENVLSKAFKILITYEA